MEPLQPMAENIARLLRERGETVAICETTAGGLVSAALLSIPGASRYYAGAAVTYTGVARSTFLEIELEDYPGVRSSSEPYAQIIASTIRERLGATWGIGETGAAGPGGNVYGDASGHTCIAISGPSEYVETLETGLEDREENMWLFTKRTLEVFESVLRGSSSQTP